MNRKIVTNEAGATPQKKSFFLLAALLLVFLAALVIVPTYGQDKKVKQKTEQQQKQKQFTCKAHPEVVSNKPGKCPKCKKPLIGKPEMKDKDMKCKGDSAKMKCDHKMAKDSAHMCDSTKMKKEKKTTGKKQ